MQFQCPKCKMIGADRNDAKPLCHVCRYKVVMLPVLPHILDGGSDIRTHGRHCEHVWQSFMSMCEFCLEIKPYSSSPEILGERSSGWFAVRNHFLKEYPRCAACGRNSNLEVHHILPFHTHPELELDRTNLITLCEYHHFIVGHKGNWKDINPTVKKDCAKLWRIYKCIVEMST